MDNNSSLLKGIMGNQQLPALLLPSVRVYSVIGNVPGESP